MMIECKMEVPYEHFGIKFYEVCSTIFKFYSFEVNQLINIPRKT